MEETCRNQKIEFIFHKYKPRYIRTNYVRLVCEIKPHKPETHIIILNAGVNLINYPGEVNTPTSDLTTIKLHVNSDILDIKSRFM